MRKLTKWFQTQIQSILSRTNKRELLILTTVLAGFVLYFLTQSKSPLVYFITDLVNNFLNYPKNAYYYTNLTVSIFKSFLIFILADYALTITRSRRIVILMSFLTLSMIMDVCSILSTDIYFALKPFRYELYIDYVFTQVSISYQSIYLYFEVACVLFSTIKLGWNYINNKTSNSITGNSWLFNPTFNSCVGGKYIAQKKD